VTSGDLFTPLPYTSVSIFAHEDDHHVFLTGVSGKVEKNLLCGKIKALSMEGTKLSGQHLVSV
jgi:hypothetical protein